MSVGVGSGGAVAWVHGWISETPMPRIRPSLWFVATVVAGALLFLALAGPYL